MKVAILGDTHFGARNDNPGFARYFEKFYADVFFPTLEEQGIKHIIQMGDVFDRRKYFNFLTAKECRRYFFERVWQGQYEYHGIVGNHDTYYKNTNRVNSPELLLGEYAERVRYYSRPTHITINNTSILMLPWICDDNQQETMEAIDQSKATVCFGHLELKGFEMYRGQKLDLARAHDPKLFSKFDIVVSGHFHHRQQIGNILYVGTPYEITWSDFDDQKGFHIFDTSSRNFTFVPNPYTLFHKVQYDDEDKQISEVNSIDFDVYRETFVKVIVRNKTNPYGFDMFIDRLEKAGVFDVQIVDDHMHADKPTEQEIASTAEDTLSTIIRSVSQLDTSIDRPALEFLMRDLYTEALKVE